MNDTPNTTPPTTPHTTDAANEPVTPKKVNGEAHEGLGQFFKDDHKKASAMPKGEKPVVVAPNLLQFDVLGDAPMTDKVLADDFYKRYQHLFVNGDGTPHIYMPTVARWSQDDVQGAVAAYAKQMAHVFYVELAQVTAEIGTATTEEQTAALHNRRLALKKVITYVEKSNVIRAIATLAWNQIRQVLKESPVVPMDADPYILGCANGVVDLRTGALRWAELKDYITRSTHVNYRPEIDYSGWSAVVLSMFGGDAEMANYIHRVIGYMATGLTDQQCAFILQGLGSNGKNLLVDVVRQSLGSYGALVPTAAFDDSTRDSTVEYSKAVLAGVRFSVSSELKDRFRVNEAFIKAVTGDNMITARHPYGRPFEFKPVFKLAILTNPRPEIQGTDDGIWRRIRLVEFRTRFGTQEQIDAGIAQALMDVTLLTRYTNDKGKEEVLAWIVAGARQYLKHGMQTPKKVTMASEGYRRDEDYLAQFLAEACDDLAPDEVSAFKAAEVRGVGNVPGDKRLYINKDTLYAAYLAWADETGHSAMNAARFKVRVLMTQPWTTRDVDGTTVTEWRHRLEAHVVQGTKGKQWVYRYARLNERGKNLYAIGTALLDRKSGYVRREPDEPAF